MKKILLLVFAILVGFAQAQVRKTTTKPKPTAKTTTEKKWVNPVKLTKEERSRPYMDEVLKTKDSLTPKEAERRRKNIALGNPFAKYGVYPKIATLSRGKYLEFHDTDSIVVIGSVRFNTKRDNIIEVREVDLSDPDAQPIGDTHGRWMSPDPLSEEFPSWSPYNYALNNPLRNVDPTGLAPEDAVEQCCWGLFRLLPLLENSSVRPSPVVEVATKTGEAGMKTGEASTRTQQEHFNLGRYVEKKQLEEMGLEKNNRTFEFKDPKTGKLERTIPDAMTKDGGTVEIKHVQKQSLTKQLRGQMEISKSNGAEALLKINETAKISKPLEKSGMNIQRYSIPKPKTDNLKVAPTTPAPKLMPVPKPKDPCAGIPGCA